jgi:hypothetical protein
LGWESQGTEQQLQELLQLKRNRYLDSTDLRLDSRLAGAEESWGQSVRAWAEEWLVAVKGGVGGGVATFLVLLPFLRVWRGRGSWGMMTLLLPIFAPLTRIKNVVLDHDLNCRLKMRMMFEKNFLSEIVSSGQGSGRSRSFLS